MTIDTGTESGKIMCQALGLNPNECRAITIHWRVGAIPYAEAELYLNEQVVYQLIQLQPMSDAMQPPTPTRTT